MLKPPDLDPRAVRRQFGRRAPRLADHDFLLREIESRMLERLDLIRLAPACVLEVGCGLGGGLSALATRYPAARVLGVDSAWPMLAAGPFGAAAAAGEAAGAERLRNWARRWLPGTRGATGSAAPRALAQRVDLVCADAAELPFGDAGIDLLWSNLAWHWFLDPPRVAGEWRRLIRPGGLLMFSAWGVDTLRELRGLGATLPEFPDMHDIGDLIGQSGFADPVVDTERLSITYETPERLLEDWRAMGGNAAPGRARGLATPRQRLKWLDAIGSLRADDGRIHLSVEIVYAHAWRQETAPAGEAWQTMNWVPRSSIRRRGST